MKMMFQNLWSKSSITIDNQLLSVIKIEELKLDFNSQINVGDDWLDRTRV